MPPTTSQSALAAPFAPVRGRPTIENRVAASRAGGHVITLWFSQDIAARLGADVGRTLPIEYGSGENAGCIVFHHTARNESGLFVFRKGQQIGANIRAPALPNVQLPPAKITLPHRWQGDSLVVDISPLQKGEAQ